MALFNDGPIITAAQLQQYENAILSVASTEGIDLGAKIALAQQDLANEIELLVRRRWSFRSYSLGWFTTPPPGVANVVVTDPLVQWDVHKTLALVYRDAYYNQLNDRYQGKWAEYEQLAKDSERTYFQIGVGLVADPIPQAPVPMLSTVTGAAAGGMFYVAVTWVNASGQEGAPSNIASLTTLDGQQLVVSASSAPSNVTGWNVYVGSSPTTLSMQNQGPSEPGGSWTMTSGLMTGVAMPAGQQPSWYMVDHRTLERG